MTTRTIIKQVPNAVLYSDSTIRLDNVRLSYPHLFDPWTNDETKPKKFGCTCIVSKATHREAQKLFVEVMNNILKEKNKGEKLKGELKFFRDGEPKDEDGTPVPAKPEYAGAWICVASERPEYPPSIRGRTGKLIKPEEKSLFYAGAVVNMLVRPWWQPDKGNGKRINANLVAVQWVRHGERIGEAGISEDEIDESFEDLGDDMNGGFEDDDDSL
jgi:hypothetical protein